MPLVNCIIHGDCDETGTRLSFFAPAPVTLANLHQLFPFEGTFHFRLNINSNLVGLQNGNHQSLWLDLTETNCVEFSSILSYDTIEIQAVCLTLPTEYVSDVQYDAYYDELDNEFQNTGMRADRLPITLNSDKDDIKKKNKGLVNHTSDVLKSISKGVKKAHSLASNTQQSIGASIMGFSKTVINGLTKTADISATAEDNLAQLSEDATTSFSEKNSVHVSVVLNLWEVLFPNAGSYQRTSDIWRTAGFQKPDPVVDLKATGILALRAMTYLCHKFPLKSQEMLQKNQANLKANYPFAIVGINLTLLLIDLLNLRDHKYLTTQGVKYWSTFDDDAAFFELFCLAFLYMDDLWRSQQAVRSDFGRLIGEVKGVLGKVLYRNPTNVAELRRYCRIEGMTEGSQSSWGDENNDDDHDTT